MGIAISIEGLGPYIISNEDPYYLHSKDLERIPVSQSISYFCPFLVSGKLPIFGWC